MDLQTAHDLVGWVLALMVMLLAWDAWEWQQQRDAARALAEEQRLRAERRLVDFVGRKRG